MRTPALLLVVALLALGPSVCPAEVLLLDDFDDGILDSGKWATPYGDVAEAGGVCRLSRRGYLSTVQEFDSSLRPIDVYCEWKWLQVDDNFSVAVRSDGVRQSVNWGQVRNGLFVTIDNYAGGTFYVVRVVNGVGTELFRTWLPAIESVGLWHTLRIIDDGSAISYYVDGSLIAALNEPQAYSENLVTFYNRELIGSINATLELDNVAISTSGPVSVEPTPWATVKALYR